MVVYGQKYCGTAIARKESTVDYYDGNAVFRQIKAYDIANKLTGDPAQWDRCISQAQATYIAQLANGRISGHHNFTMGLRMAAQAGDREAGSWVLQLASNPQASAWQKLWANTNAPYWMTAMREDSYQLEAFTNAAMLGSPQPQKTEQVVDNLLSFIHCITTECPQSGIFESFMGGLMSKALIEYSESNPADARILPALMALADWMWANAWNTWEGQDAFAYQWYTHKIGYRECDPCELRHTNHVVAPLYAWLYRQTGQQKYQIEGDAVWHGAFELPPANLYFQGKTFDQNFRWGFKYVEWRQPSFSH
jgi:hypothetical protein